MHVNITAEQAYSVNGELFIVEDTWESFYKLCSVEEPNLTMIVDAPNGLGRSTTVQVIKASPDLWQSTLASTPVTPMLHAIGAEEQKNN